MATEDIEPELGNENVVIEIPFNPNEINIKIITFTVGQLVDKLQYNEIHIPEYQRKAGLWDTKKKSRFIESLILRLPIPLFYFDERNLDQWWVIDGLQRVTTIKEFIVEKDHKDRIKSFKLEGLEFLKELNGVDWNDLKRDFQRNINHSQITINLIQNGTPEKVKHNIFRRINQGGIELSPQELRTALFWGTKTDFLKRLVSPETAEGKAFLQATDNKVKTDRQENLGFASRFVAFYILGYEKYEPDMDNFITDGTSQIPENKEEQEKIALGFLNAMNIAFEIFGNDAFRKRKSSNEARKPINQPLFEALSVAFARLDANQRSKLIGNAEFFKTELMKKQTEDTTFWNSISTGTATKDNVLKRNKDIREIVQNTIAK